MNTTSALSSKQDQNQIVFLKDNKAITTSLRVADYFGKRHDNVVRDVETIIKESSKIQGVLKIEETLNFAKTSYINQQNHQEYKIYEMDRDGFTLLAMGFTGAKALQFKLQYIAAFNAMEKQLKQQLSPPKESVRPVETLTTAIFENPGIVVAIKKTTTSGNRGIEFSFSTMLPVRIGGAVEMTPDQFDNIVATFTGELKYFLAKGFDISTFGTTKIEVPAKSPQTAEDKLNMLEAMQEKYLKALEERDDALKTKSVISDRKTASAMSKAAHLAIKNKKLLEEIKRLKKQTTERTLF